MLTNTHVDRLQNLNSKMAYSLLGEKKDELCFLRKALNCQVFTFLSVHINKVTKGSKYYPQCLCFLYLNLIMELSAYEII